MGTTINTHGGETQGRSVIILLGGPGAGKGTQAEKIARQLKIPHISTGQLLRAEAAADTTLGLRARSIMESGQLVSDDIVNEFVADRIRKEDCKEGFILDGYPRNISQAVAFESSLTWQDRQIVINIAIDLNKTVPRLSQRRTCRGCGEIYHLTASPSKRDAICDRCGDELIQRADDCEDVIRERFKAYLALTQRLTELYRRMGIYHQVDGMGSADHVAADIRQVPEQEIRSEAPARMGAGAAR